MTGLGASIYVGFFALAAIWLYLTSDEPVEPDDQGQRPERSNTPSASAESDGSSPLLASHSSQK